MKKKSLLAILLIPLAGIGIAGGAALASPSAQAQLTPNSATTAQSVVTDIQESLPDESEQNDADQEIPDAKEQQQLQAQAKITADEATVAAEAAVHGTATSVQLEDEDGIAVYAVSIGNQEVAVNAIDGSIVHVEAKDDEHSASGTNVTTGHGNEPNDGASSSDGDGETNDD